MIALGRLELRTITPLVARIKTPPNPSGQASNPYEWRQLQRQFACSYGLLVNIGHVNALIRSINHLSMLLISDEGFLMTITLANEVMHKPRLGSDPLEGRVHRHPNGLRSPMLRSRCGRRPRKAPNGRTPGRPARL